VTTCAIEVCTGLGAQPIWARLGPGINMFQMGQIRPRNYWAGPGSVSPLLQ